jgi:recombination protein RecA
MGDLIDLGVSMDIIDKRGSFYNFGELRLGQGRENAKTFLDENETIADEIEVLIRNNAGLVTNFAASGDDSEVATALDDDAVSEMDLAA